MRELNRRQLALGLIALLAFVACAVGVLGLLRGPRSPGAPGPTAHPPTRPARPVGTREPDASSGASSPAGLPVLPSNADPVGYARAIASALFDWDTSSGYLPSDYTAPVLADADPSGEEAPGLIADVATYLPTAEQWLNLATMDVTQSLAIKSATVPADWPSILQQAHGQLRPGTTAVTISGTRVRRGVWNGHSATQDYPVSFTIFVACPPAFDRCHVLRLSQLDDPLE